MINLTALLTVLVEHCSLAQDLLVQLSRFGVALLELGIYQMERENQGGEEIMNELNHCCEGSDNYSMLSSTTKLLT